MQPAVVPFTQLKHDETETTLRKPIALHDWHVPLAYEWNIGAHRACVQPAGVPSLQMEHDPLTTDVTFAKFTSREQKEHGKTEASEYFPAVQIEHAVAESFPSALVIDPGGHS